MKFYSAEFPHFNFTKQNLQTWINKTETIT